MRRRFARPLLFVLLATGLLVGAALAEDQNGESGFVRFLEGLLSTPDRHVSLTGFHGIFSSHPTLDRIEVADKEGVWLRLEGVEVVWNRAALLDRMVDIDVLRAKSVTVLRKPVAGEASGSAGGVGAPPIAINIRAIALPNVTLAEPVVGAKAELVASGSARLSEDALAAQLSVDRQDRAGTLSLNLRLEPAKKLLTADLKLAEPAGGIAADLLGLRGSPAMSVALSGSGPLDKWQANLEVKAADKRVLAGAMSIVRADAGYQVRADLAAALETLAPEDYAVLLKGESRLGFDLIRGDDGRLTIRSATFHSASTDLSASGVLAADFFPENAKLSLAVGGAGQVRLPFVPNDISVAGLHVDAALDAGSDAPWQMQLSAQTVEAPFGRIAGFAINASGEAHDMLNAEPARNQLQR